MDEKKQPRRKWGRGEEIQEGRGARVRVGERKVFCISHIFSLPSLFLLPSLSPFLPPSAPPSSYLSIIYYFIHHFSWIMIFNERPFNKLLQCPHNTPDSYNPMLMILPPGLLQLQLIHRYSDKNIGTHHGDFLRVLNGSWSNGFQKSPWFRHFN